MKKILLQSGQKEKCNQRLLKIGEKLGETETEYWRGTKAICNVKNVLD